MSTTIDIPGGTAVLRDADDLSNRDVKTLQRTMRSAATAAVKMKEAGYEEGSPESWAAALSQLSDDELNDIDLYQRACTILRLESWTLDRPIPTNADEVDDLPRALFAAVTAAAADISLSEEFGLDGAADPKAPIAS